MIEKGGSAAGESDQPGEGPPRGRPAGQEAAAASEAETQSAEANAAQVAESGILPREPHWPRLPSRNWSTCEPSWPRPRIICFVPTPNWTTIGKGFLSRSSKSGVTRNWPCSGICCRCLMICIERIEAGEKSGETSGLLAGVRMITEQLEQVLARHHCFRIEAEGKPFDPNLHEAVGQQPSDIHPPNTVLQVVRTGYQLHDRLVRPAQVIISVGPAPAPANN